MGEFPSVTDHRTPTQTASDDSLDGNFNPANASKQDLVPVELSNQPSPSTITAGSFSPATAGESNPRQTSVDQLARLGFSSEALLATTLASLTIFEQEPKDAQPPASTLDKLKKHLEQSKKELTISGSNKELETCDHKEEVEVIDLSGSKVTDQGLSLLTQYPNLKELKLGSLTISPDTIKQLKRLPKLERLNLQGAKFTGSSLGRLHELSPLRNLDLSYTTLSSEDIRTFMPTVKLTDLTLNGMSTIDTKTGHLAPELFDDFLRIAAAKSPALEILDLSNNKVSTRGLAGLDNCKKLIAVKFTGKDIDLTTGISALRNTSARFLIFNNTNLTDQKLKELVNNDRIRTLDLSNTMVTDASIPFLQRMRPPVTLGLNGTAISPQGYLTLRESLPANSRIVYDANIPNKDTFTKQEAARKSEEEDLRKRFGIEFSKYEVLEWREKHSLPCRVPTREELAVVKDVLDRGVTDTRSGEKPLRFIFLIAPKSH